MQDDNTHKLGLFSANLGRSQMSSKGKFCLETDMPLYFLPNSYLPCQIRKKFPLKKEIIHLFALTLLDYAYINLTQSKFDRREIIARVNVHYRYSLKRCAVSRVHIFTCITH